jgi:xanthine dehydrogenase accessory factor
MTCASEGAIDVYVEPFGPARRLVIIGATPVADALARSAVLLNFDVVRVVATEELQDLQAESRSSGIAIAALESLESLIEKAGQDAAVVVASQGHYDEESLEVVLKRSVSYVGLVASRKRGATVRAYLEGRGVGVTALNAIRNPAGIDLGARTAPEVALSILAEIVQARPVAAAVDMQLPPPATAVDPICGMDVDVATARHTAEVEGTSYYFCCAQCRARFVADPHAFLHSRA